MGRAWGRGRDYVIDRVGSAGSGPADWPALLAGAADEALQVLASDITRDGPRLPALQAGCGTRTLATWAFPSTEALGCVAVLRGPEACQPVFEVYEPYLPVAIRQFDAVLRANPDAMSLGALVLLSLVNVLRCCDALRHRGGWPGGTLVSRHALFAPTHVAGRTPDRRVCLRWQHAAPAHAPLPPQARAQALPARADLRPRHDRVRALSRCCRGHRGARDGCRSRVGGLPRSHSPRWSPHARHSYAGRSLVVGRQCGVRAPGGTPPLARSWTICTPASPLSARAVTSMRRVVRSQDHLPAARSKEPLPVRRRQRPLLHGGWRVFRTAAVVLGAVRVEGQALWRGTALPPALQLTIADTTVRLAIPSSPAAQDGGWHRTSKWEWRRHAGRSMGRRLRYASEGTESCDTADAGV